MPAEHASTSQHTVLVVDDEPGVCTALHGLLAREGLDVLVAHGADEALAITDYCVPTLAMVDIMMPGIDGLELCRRLHGQPSLAQMPVILMSVLSEPADIESGIAAGAVDYVLKPFDTETVKFRVRAQLELCAARQQEQRLRDRLEAISRAAQDAIVMMDSSGAITHWNEAAEAMFGLSRDEALGRNLHQWLAPARYHGEHLAAMERFRETGLGGAVGRTVELTAKRSSGEEFPVELSLSTTQLDGEWCAVGIVRDISERKAEEARRRLLEAAVEQAAETVVITDANGVIEYVNPAFERLTGYTRDEVVGQSPAVLKSGRHDSAFYHDLWSTIRAGRTWQGHFINQRKDGSLFEEEATISPLLDAEGTITNFIAVKRDVTDVAALRRQLAQSQKLEAVGQLAAGIAHEINTPTQYVGDSIHFLHEAFEGFARLLPMYQQLAEEARAEGRSEALLAAIDEVADEVDLEYLVEQSPSSFQLCFDGVERVATIVRAMKEFAHPDQRGKSPADLNQALSSTLTIATNEYKYVARAETDFGELPPVTCHIGELNQVFLNLIVNAAHAIAEAATDGGEKGVIRVSTRRDGDYACVQIADTGAGIPEAVRDRIFEPFFTTKPVGKGCGQGLAIARSIVVDKHQGTIDFETELGVGTTFTIRLPLDAGAPGSAETDP